MLLHTSRFGSLDISEEEIFTFPSGLPGFESYRRYVILQQKEYDPFLFLQCVDNGELSFFLIDPFAIYPDYEVILDEPAKQELQAEEGDSRPSVLVYAIVSIRDSLEKATLNLMAPVVLNMEKKIGKQLILHHSGYMTRHPLIPQATGQVPAKTEG